MDQRRSDQELVALTLQDRHAYGALVERYEATLRRYAARLGADDETAKDILQESFIKAYVNLNDYDSAQSFSAWIYRIVHNEAINQFRKAKTQPVVLGRAEDLTLFDTIPDELDMFEEAHAKTTGAAVRSALDLLDSRYRDVLVLRFFENKSYDEISDILQIPSGTVATNINRGKAKLLELIKKSKAMTEN